MGFLTNKLSQAFGAAKGAFRASGVVGATNFNKPMTGTLSPTVGFSAPVQKGPNIDVALSHVAGSAGGTNGQPKT